MKHDWIQPAWPAPDHVRAVSTTRTGGGSKGAWNSLNLGLNCGDDPELVSRNRNSLDEILPQQPCWLRQVHGRKVHIHDKRNFEPEADAIVAFDPGQVCAVLTADCLPVLFCSRSGDRVAAAHAGWRGLAAGILSSTITALNEPPENLLAWLGPAIGPAAYEVGEEVVAEFPVEFPAGFTRHGNRWLMDLYTLARIKLKAAGVDAIYGGDLCTYSDAGRFFSYRRDDVTGRMASLIWFE